MLDFCKIKNSKVNLFPFPYIDVENYLSEQQVEDVNLNWPQEKVFKTNQEGLSIFALDLDNLSREKIFIKLQDFPIRLTKCSKYVEAIISINTLNI